MCDYNDFFAFFEGIWSPDENSAGWENASGLAFSESKMAPKWLPKRFKSIFCHNFGYR